MSRILILLLGFLSAISTQAGTIVLNGNYQGKDLYIQNPFAGDGAGYCVTKVEVNGEETKDEINASAFKIDLKRLNLAIGTPVEVKIFHGDDCLPRVIHDTYTPRSTVDFDSIYIDSTHTLKWATSREAGALPFLVEQKRWNKWIKVGEVEGKGIAGQTNLYEFKLDLHSGENEFRVKQLDITKVPRYSPSVKVMSDGPIVEPCGPFKGGNAINFTTSTMYEVYDKDGNIQLKGEGTTIDISKLQRGIYYLAYDNTTQKFIKKKDGKSGNEINIK